MKNPFASIPVWFLVLVSLCKSSSTVWGKDVDVDTVDVDTAKRLAAVRLIQSSLRGCRQKRQSELAQESSRSDKSTSGVERLTRDLKLLLGDFSEDQIDQMVEEATKTLELYVDGDVDVDAQVVLPVGLVLEDDEGPKTNKNFTRARFSPPSPEAETQLPAESECPLHSMENQFELLGRNQYADRHFRRVADILDKKACTMYEMDMDMSDVASFDTGAAVDILQQCRLLVLRNAFSTEKVMEFHDRFEKYVLGLHSGMLNSTGRTTLGEGLFVTRRSRKRWDILLPRYLADTDLLANPHIIDIVLDKKILGEMSKMLGAGAILAEPGAPTGGWHHDDPYIFGDDSFGVAAVGGHDLPPYAINMMTPLLPVTYDHGPTEFCVGSSNFKGLFPKGGVEVWDQDLLEQYPLAKDLYRFEKKKKVKLKPAPPCPAPFMRIPVLGMGDVVLFDFQITHRGGPNTSKDLRSMLYATYSRKWFRDSNFEYEKFDGTTLPSWQEQMMQNSRFAEIKDPPDVDTPPAACKSPECDEHKMPTLSLESITNFLHREDDDDKSQPSQGLGKPKYFWITNVDIDGATVDLGDGDIRTIEPGESLDFTLPAGTRVGFRNKDGMEVRSWTILKKQRQIVISEAMITS
jgi:ectoine hydroxylase-related dioxygenase (phytanoyl-CoA dioxygenase family)